MKVLIFGTFDRLHPGHRFVLDEAEKRGEMYVVVARDVNVQHFKGHAPQQSETERQKGIQDAYPRAHVLLGHETDYLVPVHMVQPDCILLGYDQQLPPGIEEADLPCKIERLEPFEPEKYKSSLLNG